MEMNSTHIQKLVDAEPRYRTLFEQFPDGILLIDTKGKIIEFNEAAHRRLGYTREEFAALNLSDINVSWTPQELRESIQRVLQEKEAEFEVQHRTKSGEIRDVQVITHAIELSGRTVLHALWRDITGRRQAEKTLESAILRAIEGKDTIKAVIAAIGCGVSIQDTDYKILFQNQAHKNMVGEHIGEYCYKAYQGRDRVCEGCHVAMAFSDGRVHTKEQSRMTSGGMQYFEITASPLRDPSGRIIGAIEAVWEITGRKRTEKALRESEERFRLVAESAKAIVYDIDVESGTTVITRGLSEILGYAPEEKPSASDWWYGLIHPDDFLTVDRTFKESIAHASDFVLEYRLLHKSGDYITVQDTGKVVRDSSGRVVRIVGGVVDITERRKAEAALSASEKKLRHLYDSMSDGVAMTDREGRIVECNRTFLHMLGYTETEVKRLSSRDITPAKWYAMEESIIESQVFPRGYSDEYEKEYLRKDGTVFPVAVKTWLIRNGEGDPLAMWCLVRDITERKKLEATIRYQAYHDSLTGLPNRALFTDRLNLELAQARRDHTRLAVLFLDIDRFKGVNDSLGHPAGDQLLKEAAHRLKWCVRQSDTIARFGGDEFAILLPSVAHAEDIAVTAEKIIGAILRPFVIEDHELHVTTSIGISIYPEDGEHPEVLLKHADIAMYHAKGQGRNNFQFYNATINIRTLERMILENNLRHTLDHGALTIYYQPQLDLTTRSIVSAEALVRWRHPDLGLLNPVQFVPLAEETGLILSLDEWVLRTACAQNKAWQERGHTPMSVTVNISARQFMQPDFADMVSAILQETGLHPQFLEIEITENIAMRDIERTIPQLHRLTEMGVNFSIDDFGSGYSSLGHLKNLPVHRLKIDKSFIRGLIARYEDRAIVKAVVVMAHNLKMRVVAEGVETEEELSFLRATGCDEAQGFIVSEPLPAEEFEQYIVAAC
ncbi:MAG: EAL domain-containing protein [Nitrospirota bacterium]